MSQTEDPTPALTDSVVPDADMIKTPPPIDTTPRSQPRRGGFLGGLVGGVVAAGLGFGAAQLYPKGWPLAVTGDLQAMLTQQATEIEALKVELAKLSQPVPADTQLADRITALESKAPPAVDLSPVDSRIAALESRLSAIETLPTDGTSASPAALAALRADVEALKTEGAVGLEGVTQKTEDRLKAVEERAATLQSETEAMVAKARARTALGQVMAAMDSGVPYASLLADLGAVPEALSAPAASGIPTIAQLRDGFPNAARLALEASLQADMGATWADRIGSFLRTQTGARSLQPREGNDPDAVLSRAEASLAQGDLAAALAQLDSLPEPGKAAMADWHTKAEQRLAAIAALSSLTATIDG
ncbi:COG4223 family protein [Fuscibacter oryzae]|uniref:Inner membrane protein n=1 Tax=Fuscibacter oryzae TaxID=2803939 RepID=A0A8J7MWK2_9RHOB|nr:mitofilin family membrane protein [Fuscibacter oryzae]MBL4929029.1 hypothetical protein [Fuscibacter oryzae]